MAGRLSEDDTFVEYVCDQLGSIDGISHRAMFGGHGLYCGSTFFGIAYRSKLYFKTNEETRAKYVAWEMGPFQPNAKQRLNSYYEAPPDCIDDATALTELAEEAIDAAMKGE